MGKRNVAKITVDGTDYTLMQFSDFSYIPNRYDATRYQMELANGIYYPTGVSVQGNTMNDIIPQGIGSSADNVSKPIDNYNAILLKQVPASQGNANFFSFYNSSNELLFEEGYLMTNYESNTLVNFAIVIDDDGFADVIGVMHYYNGSVTATRIDHFGGNGEIGQKIYAVFAQEASQSYTSNGGGATHIAKVTGQLKDLSSNLSDILMVSGGGGGGLLSGETEYTGKEAGGISGSGDNSADQSTGNAFGQGESGTNVSGGGSGLYGGYKGTSSKSGGAGSGYIGNSLLSNKKMVGYNVPTSDVESTKTESVNDVSSNAVSGKPKSGNGFARIKFLQEIDFFGFIEHMNVTDSSTRFEYIGANTGYTPLTVDLSGTHLPSYNSWSDFSYLFKNKPYMVKADGTADYQLSETDYTKKSDGVTTSDVKNTSYNGCGAFAWLPKIYTKQEIVGNDRYVYFSLTPKTGYDALGFKCLENGVEQELEGLWIPMFYGTMQNNKLMSICNDGKPTYNITIGAFKTGIENLSSRARFFGGAIINVIADLLMLLSRKGDIPTVFGNGVINASQSAWYPDSTIPTQSVVGTDRFWGYSDGNHLTKIFHSLLSSGILWQYDPYFKVKNSKFYHCPHYEWGEDVTSDISAITTSGYFYATQFGLVDGFGRVPIHPMSSTPIEPYYMYTNSLTSPSDSYSCRNGNYGSGRRGWYARTFDSNFNYTVWDRNASPMILPPVGYKPN